MRTAIEKRLSITFNERWITICSGTSETCGRRCSCSGCFASSQHVDTSFPCNWMTSGFSFWKYAYYYTKLQLLILPEHSLTNTDAEIHSVCSIRRFSSESPAGNLPADVKHLFIKLVSVLLLNWRGCHPWNVQLKTSEWCRCLKQRRNALFSIAYRKIRGNVRVGTVRL